MHFKSPFLNWLFFKEYINKTPVLYKYFYKVLEKICSSSVSRTAFHDVGLNTNHQAHEEWLEMSILYENSYPMYFINHYTKQC